METDYGKREIICGDLCGLKFRHTPEEHGAGRNNQEEIIYFLVNALDCWNTDRAKAKRYVEFAIDKAKAIK